jgi:hypothetical protein
MESATFGNATSVGIHGNHSDMAKFSGGDSIGYIRVVAGLKRQLANLEKGGKEQLENKTVSRSSIYGSTLLN